MCERDTEMFDTYQELVEYRWKKQQAVIDQKTKLVTAKKTLTDSEFKSSYPDDAAIKELLHKYNKIVGRDLIITIYSEMSYEEFMAIQKD